MSPTDPPKIFCHFSVQHVEKFYRLKILKYCEIFFDKT